MQWERCSSYWPKVNLKPNLEQDYLSTWDTRGKQEYCYAINFQPDQNMKLSQPLTTLKSTEQLNLPYLEQDA